MRNKGECLMRVFRGVSVAREMFGNGHDSYGFQSFGVCDSFGRDIF